jgi:hypothetical protein
MSKELLRKNGAMSPCWRKVCHEGNKIDGFVSMLYERW